MMYDFETRVFEGTPEEFEACVRILDSRHVCSCTATPVVMAGVAPSPTASITEAVAQGPTEGVTPAVGTERGYSMSPAAIKKRRQRAAKLGKTCPSPGGHHATVSPSETPSEGDICPLSRDMSPKGGGGDFSFSSLEKEENTLNSPLSPSSLSSEEDLSGQDREGQGDTLGMGTSSEPRDIGAPPASPVPPSPRLHDEGAPSLAKPRGVALNEWNAWKQAWISDYERIVEAHLGTTWAFPAKEIHSFQTVMTKFCTGANANPANVAGWLKSILVPFIDEQATREVHLRGYAPGNLLTRLNKCVPLVAAPSATSTAGQGRRASVDNGGERAHALAEKLQIENRAPTEKELAFLREWNVRAPKVKTVAQRATERAEAEAICEKIGYDAEVFLRLPRKLQDEVRAKAARGERHIDLVKQRAEAEAARAVTPPSRPKPAPVEPAAEWTPEELAELEKMRRAHLDARARVHGSEHAAE